MSDSLDAAPAIDAGFQIDPERYPLAWFSGAVAPVTIAPAFDEQVMPLALDELRRPHDPAARDRLEAACRALAETLVTVAAEDGHPFMLAAALHALVRRAAESEARA